MRVITGFCFLGYALGCFRVIIEFNESPETTTAYPETTNNPNATIAPENTSAEVQNDTGVDDQESEKAILLLNTWSSYSVPMVVSMTGK